mgnify:CR=1 FL=1
MGEKKTSPPSKLLKKKCHCGHLLKVFSIIGAPYLPEWNTLPIIKKETSADGMTILPGRVTSDLLWGAAFVSTCESCGNISAWYLTSEEIDYLLSGQKEDGYGVAWVYNPDYIKNFYNKPELKYIFQKILGAAEEVEKARLNFEGKNEKK